MNIRSKKGFTLVEIMIVVVIIGLLAAMAIPAFQKVRTDSIAKAMVNDARQLGAAMQQIGTEYSQVADGTVVIITVDSETGDLTSGAVAAAGIPANEVRKYVNRLSKGYKRAVADLTLVITYTYRINNPAEVAFTMRHPQVAPEDAIKGSDVNVGTTKMTDISFLSDGKAAMEAVAAAGP